MKRGTLAVMLMAPVAWCQTETLHYTINWPSGLSLGEAVMKAERSGDGWSYEMTMEATIPGFPVKGVFRSVVAKGSCSVSFEKDSLHGKRRAREKSSFDREKRVVVRETIGGGKSEIEADSCARDALAFLYFLRNELAAGRVPVPQRIFFGAPYQIRLQHLGAAQMTVGESRIEVDRFSAMLKGPASEMSFEMAFTRDEERVPVQIRLSVALGHFVMELVPRPEQ